MKGTCGKRKGRARHKRGAALRDLVQFLEKGRWGRRSLQRTQGIKTNRIRRKREGEYKMQEKRTGGTKI